MLHKSFKPAKCKTSLKLATSRIKLMRNKKGVQINQMKRDLAQLLETGQDRTARIRVEHVIREEKMVAAYDLIEIYCELIVARMPIIESQKTCPIDMKEAVTSVIFAAPRCSDITELAAIKKHFTAKYGKEFVSAALELRPDSGVSRMLVEKLSAVAPDVQTKVKVLTSVAKEHNINWEPTSFEEKESKPPNDLLNGPINLENASMANVDPPKIQQSNVNDVHRHEEKPGPPLDFSQQNRKFVLDNNVGSSSSGVPSDKMEMKQNWNMGFKDATSAAQAAAESAERAAMAARAAAQFSSQEKIHVSNFRDEAPRVSASFGDDRSKDSNESSSGDSKPKVPNQKRDQEHDTLQNDTERFHEAKKESSESENINFFADEENEKQPSVRSSRSHSHSSNSGDELGVPGHQEAGKRTAVGNPFAVSDQRNPFKESPKTRSDFDDSRDDKTAFFEESPKTRSDFDNSRDDKTDFFRESPKTRFDFDDSRDDKTGFFNESPKTRSDFDDSRDEKTIFDDDGGPRFDTGFEYDEDNLENSHIWSPKRNESKRVEQTSSKSHLFSESVSFGEHSVKSVEPSETDDRVHASFDHSDGPDSENESENKEFTSNEHDLFSANHEPSRKSRIELNDLVEVESSSLEDNDGSLNFGKLTGGMRNKGDGGLRYPLPNTRSTTTETSYLSKKPVEESFITGHKTSNQSSLDSSRESRFGEKNKKQSVSISSSDSDSDDYGDKFPARSRFVPPAAFFDGDDDDDGTVSEKLVPKRATGNVRMRSELSRRTRGSPSVEDKTVISRKPTSRNEVKSAEKQDLGSENLVKKPSYVHPKLPDYDSLAARLQSLRSEHQ